MYILPLPLVHNCTSAWQHEVDLWKFLILLYTLDSFQVKNVIYLARLSLKYSLWMSVTLILNSLWFTTGRYVSRSSWCLLSNRSRVIQIMAGAWKQDRWYNNNHCAYPGLWKCMCIEFLILTAWKLKKNIQCLAENLLFLPKFTQSGPAGSDKVDYGSIGASIAVHTMQSEIPVFVPSEAINRCAATEMQSSSSGSPTERSLSCVVPSPTHPLLTHGRMSDAFKPVQSEQAASQPMQSWHQVGGSTELEQSMQRSIPPASCWKWR